MLIFSESLILGGKLFHNWLAKYVKDLCNHLREEASITRKRKSGTKEEVMKAIRN